MHPGWPVLQFAAAATRGLTASGRENGVASQIRMYPNPLGAKTNRLQRVLRGRSEPVHAVFVEVRGIINPQGYHLRTPKNCPTAWGHLSRGFLRSILQLFSKSSETVT